MTTPASRTFTTPREADLGLRRITNAAGLSISVLPNGCVFAIEHEDSRGRTLVNQVLGSPLDGGIGRLFLRTGAPKAKVVQAVGPYADLRLGAADDRFVWEGESFGIRHRVTLWLHPREAMWFWRVEATNTLRLDVPCDAILVQDVGLGGRGFLMNNEAYASQYIDHHVATDPRVGPVVMSRQNLSQSGKHPWVMHGCLDGAAGFATDALQLFGPEYRDADNIGPDLGIHLASRRLQHEAACPMIQSRLAPIAPGETVAWTFFAAFEADHPAASSDEDLSRVDAVQNAAQSLPPLHLDTQPAVRTRVQSATPAVAYPLSDDDIAQAYPQRLHEERFEGRLVSFFTPDAAGTRHIVLREKERTLARRHGTLLRTGQGTLLDETTMCATGWAHGVFAAQLTIGNTSFHKLFSVSRDPYNITRSSGLRILFAEDGISDDWRMLTVPSAFDMGLNDCRWVYRFDERTITVHAIGSGDEPAMQWRVSVEGRPCRFLVFGHLVLGERELDHASRVEIDAPKKRLTFRPDPNWLWGQRYPQAVYHLVTSTPGAVEAVGGDELLYQDGQTRNGAYVAMRTASTNELVFSVVGSMTDTGEAERLALKHEKPVAAIDLLQPAERYWQRITRGLRITGNHPSLSAFNTAFPWFAHNAIIHFTLPHGLEQYTGAAWGTRDVCQGPVEFFLPLGHDAEVKEILRIVFAQQYADRGDWPQWFMLEPYSNIQDNHPHGDVIVWPLKALCDYLEATNDLAFLDELIAWRREDNFEKTSHTAPVSAHIDKLLSTVRAAFIPGTHLIRYGDGDWNDSLQPADPKMRDLMVSAWTVALLYQQLNRYAEVLRRAKRPQEAAEVAKLAVAMREDFNKHLIRGGTVAGYALFEPGRGEPELLLHPTDTRTGLKFSLLPMTRSIIGGMFTPEQAAHHLRLIREHLLYPDGVRLMDKPATYRGGPERVFRRAESASFFGREIGIMYVHAHLRYAEAMAKLGEADALWEALQVVNPIAVTELLPHASPRQRNAYFSSSDAAFRDRYEATAQWDRVKRGEVAVDGGWRIYSSGPGLFTNMLLSHAFGRRRFFGESVAKPVLPASLGHVDVEWDALRPTRA